MTLGLLGTLLAVVVALRLAVGGEGLGWPADSDIAALRARRVAIGSVVGGALALAGVLLQSLLRNPLASPDLLGLASGAGLGVTLSFAAGYWSGTGLVAIAGTNGPALAGSMAALAVVYLLAQRRGLVDPVPLILLGVIVSIIASAATLLVQSLLPGGAATLGRWLMGALRDEVSTAQLAAAWAVAAGAIALSLRLAPAMDAAALDDDEALSLGVRLGRLRLSLLLMAGVLTAATVVLAGPIGFVGLVCPHAVRLLAGPAHRPLLVGSVLAGAALVVGADAVVKVVETPTGRLPIGVLTTLIGGPVFILLLRAEMR